MNLADDVPGCTGAEEIGAGGYGRVYRARQPAFDRVVAVKILNGRLDDADTLRRFQRECQAIGVVAGHPNIVGVHDAGGTPSGHPYIVMPYLRRGSLAQRLRNGPLPWQQAVTVCIKIAGALHSAHQAGVLHRDIKPENILLSDYGEPQLADFGIAQRLGSVASTATAAAMTPAQGAPELLAGDRPSVASDVYSLASTLHTLIMGDPPFVRRNEQSVFAMLARIATEPPPDLRPYGVPDAVARVVEHGMAKAPQDRPASALDFGVELQRAQTAVGLPATVLPLADEDDVTGTDVPPPPAGFAAQTPPARTPPAQTPPAQTPPAPAFPGGGYPDAGYPDAGYPDAAYPVAAPSGYPAGAYPETRPDTRPGTPGAPGAPGAPGRQSRQRDRDLPRRFSPRVLAVSAIAVVVVAVGAAFAFHTLSASDPNVSATTGRSGTASGRVTPSGTASRQVLEALLTPTQLGDGWKAVDAGPATADLAFCNKPLAVGADDRATVMLQRAAPPAVASHQAVRRPGGGAKTLLDAVRASARRCTTWQATEDGVRVTYTLQPVAKGSPIGDDSAEYLLSRTGGDATLNVVQVYARKGDMLSILSYAARSPSSPDDISFTETIARSAVGHLA